MPPILSIAIILILFFVISHLADGVVRRARALGTSLGIGTFFLGILLGLFTSAPEATIAINAAAQQAPALSVGNFIGGTVVLFGLIAGLLALRSHSLPVKQGSSGLMAAAFYLVLPVFFIMDQRLTALEGAVLAVGYIAVLFLVFGASRKLKFQIPHPHITTHAGRDIAMLIAGTAGIAIASGIIVRLTVPLAETFGIPAFAIGIIAYSLGTNLPELMVAIRASRTPDSLPVATLVGSALANPFLLGLLAIGVRDTITFSGAFLAIATCYAAVVLLFFLFVRTGRHLTRLEGAMLVMLYLAFIVFSLRAG